MADLRTISVDVEALSSLLDHVEGALVGVWPEDLCRAYDSLREAFHNESGQA